MSVIKRNIQLLEKKQGAALAAVSLEQTQQTTSEIDALIMETNKLTQGIAKKLKAMDAENKEAAKSPSEQTKVRVNMHATLTRKFLTLSQEYSAIQEKYKAAYRDRMERQIKIVSPESTEAEVDAMVADPNTQIFAQQILSSGHMAAKNAVLDIQERHKEITMLEASIAELHQLFMDMAVLVEAQGEMLDQIERSVELTVKMTEKGVGQLDKAVKSQKKNRKRACGLMAIGVVVLFFLLSN